MKITISWLPKFLNDLAGLGHDFLKVEYWSKVLPLRFFHTRTNPSFSRTFLSLGVKKVLSRWIFGMSPVRASQTTPRKPGQSSPRLPSKHKSVHV